MFFDHTFIVTSGNYSYKGFNQKTESGKHYILGNGKNDRLYEIVKLHWLIGFICSIYFTIFK